MLWLALLLIKSLVAQCSVLVEKKQLVVVCWVNELNLPPVSASVRAREEMASSAGSKREKEIVSAPEVCGTCRPVGWLSNLGFHPGFVRLHGAPLL